MPASRATLNDIDKLGLDHTIAHSSIGPSGHLKNDKKPVVVDDVDLTVHVKSEQVEVVIDETHHVEQSVCVVEENIVIEEPIVPVTELVYEQTPTAQAVDAFFEFGGVDDVQELQIVEQEPVIEEVTVNSEILEMLPEVDSLVHDESTNVPDSVVMTDKQPEKSKKKQRRGKKNDGTEN